MEEDNEILLSIVTYTISIPYIDYSPIHF